MVKERMQLRLLALLLDYPDERLLEGRDEVEHAIAALEPSPGRDGIAEFARWLYATDPFAIAQQYVASFDFSKRTSLHLSWFSYGDRRQRGMAMVALKQRFAAAGLPLADGALPDFLPAVLEFAALAPPAEADAVLAELRGGIEIVRAGLREAGSQYALLLDALVAGLPRLTREERDALARLAAEGPPTELVGLEPFAPPEVMPAPRRGCATAVSR